MDRVKEFKPCPLCGQTDMLRMTPRNHFYEFWNMPPTRSSLVTMRCERCSLELHEHTIENAYIDRLHTNNYDIVVGELKKRWNSIKR